VVDASDQARGFRDGDEILGGENLVLSSRSRVTAS